MRKYVLMCKTTLSMHAINADPTSWKWNTQVLEMKSQIYSGYMHNYAMMIMLLASKSIHVYLSLVV